jgi:asparagine synthase (glutamine-hydrolysing)
MQVGFSVRIRDDQLEFQFFGQRPGQPRSLVAHARHGDVHAVLMGRLTYRDELVDQLPPEPASPSLADDAVLALAAYRHGGAAGLARLEGNFAVVIWDGCKKRLLGMRDPLGGYPLFWTNPAGTLAFSTCLRPLLQLLPHRSLNLDHAAEFLATPGLWVEEVVTDHCAYEGIHRVLPGSLVQAPLSGGPVQQQMYWDWVERMVDPGPGGLEEYSSQVAHGLRQAVRQHLRGTVAAHLSGGMDSTSVALLARDGLSCEPGQAPVHAISAVFDRLGGLSRETPYLECALRQPGIVPHLVPCDDILDYDCFADPPFHDEPYTKLAVLGVGGKLVEAAAQTGADTLLTGEGADGVLDCFPHHLTDLLRRGRLWKAWSVARAWGRATTQSAWHFLWQCGLVNLMPAGWRAGLGPLWRRGYAAWQRQGPGTIAPWVRPDFARVHALRERGLAHIRRQSCSGQPMNVSLVLSLLRGVCGDGCRWSVAAPQGMAIAHPFLDARFVCLCLGIQARFRPEPGSMKPLLAHAMRDVLPEPIRNRRVKGHYNSMTHAGLARNLPVLEALVRQAPVDDLGLFDKEALLGCLQQAALGLAPVHALTRLDLTLAWLRWYSLQEEWQKPMTPAAVLRVAQPGRPPKRTTALPAAELAPVG